MEDSRKNGEDEETRSSTHHFHNLGPLSSTFITLSCTSFLTGAIFLRSSKSEPFVRRRSMSQETSRMEVSEGELI
jgi:hypothetical protein